MPNPLELRRRIKSVDNTRQITRAMQLVAASRMRRAQEAVESSRPYSHHMTDVVHRLVGARGSESLPLLLRPRPIKRTAVVVMTTNRGLAGPLNTNIIRAAVNEMDELGGEGRISLLVVGRKGQVALAGSHKIQSVFNEMSDQPTRADVAPIVQAVTAGYRAGDFDEVRVIYPEFVNTLTQRPSSTRVLPVLLADEQHQARELDLILEPDASTVLEDIVPKYVEMTFYQALLELVASEQSARMVAMRAATENATELIENLRRAYNKLRQARITSEIIDIASGAKALADA